MEHERINKNSEHQRWNKHVGEDRSEGNYLIEAEQIEVKWGVNVADWSRARTSRRKRRAMKKDKRKS